jgi:Family of unknown function (DUF6481)
MSPFKFDDFNERRDAAAKAKQAMLEKFRAKQRPAAPAADTTQAATPEAAAPEPVAKEPDGGSEAGSKAPRKAGKAGKTRK